MEKRNYTLSLIRLISLIMIFCCHILQGLGYSIAFWVNLGVQIFFFLSGFLYGNKKIVDIKNWLIKRLQKILLPYTILIIIVLILELLFLKSDHYYLKVIANILGFQATYQSIATTSHTWFVTYILFCYLMVPFLQKIFIKKNTNAKHLIFLSVFITLIYFFRIINLNAAWLINFIFGYYFAKLNKEKQKKFLKVIIILGLITLPLKLIYNHDIINSLYYIFLPYKTLICDFNHVFIGSSLFVLLYFIFNKINIKKKLILDLSDKYSYFIYLTHQIFILNSFSILFVTKFIFVNIFLIILCSIISGIALYYFYIFILKLSKNIFYKCKNIKKSSQIKNI